MDSRTCWVLTVPRFLPHPRTLFSSSSFSRADRRLRQKRQAVYNYPVLREALNVMSQVPAADQQGGGSKQIPLLLMRTVLESVQRFPELKNFVATVVLVRLVQHQVGAVGFIFLRHLLRASGMLCRWRSDIGLGETSFYFVLHVRPDLPSQPHWPSVARYVSEDPPWLMRSVHPQ